MRFLAAMDDDFNTADAMSVLFDLAREANRLRDSEPGKAARHAATLRRLGAILGLLQRSPEEFLQGGEVAGLSAEQIDALIAQRTAARGARNWAESDRIRDELKAQGIVLEDGSAGTTWRRQ
jgi:cysteinyl-tRNA synthetase